MIIRLLLLCAGTLLAHAGENLLKNGDFEAGEGQAEHWEPVNGLTSEWVRMDDHGRVLKMDTRVHRHQARDWAATFAENPDAPRPEKQLVKPPGYDSIGGTDGVMLDSHWIDCEPGQKFKLAADLRGPGAPFVWIKGFLHHRGRWRDAYQTRLIGFGATEDQWRRYEIGFCPTAHSELVSRFKVRCYAYWPNGIYYFDNVRVEAISEEEYAALVAEREKLEPERAKLAAERAALAREQRRRDREDAAP